jgi:hypothetical protein
VIELREEENRIKDRDDYLDEKYTAYTNSKREVKIHINGRDLILVPYVKGA